LCGSGVTKNGCKYIIDPFTLTAQLINPSDVTSLINGLAQILLPVSLNPAQVVLLKEVLIPGLPDSTWTYEWDKHAGNPNDAAQKSLISKKLIALLKAMLSMPEFYLA